MVLSEAGAVGLPLVSTDVGAIREIVRPEQTGLLVPPERRGRARRPRSIDSHAEPSWRRSLGANAKQLVRDEFNAATNASRLVDLLVDVTRRHR